MLYSTGYMVKTHSHNKTKNHCNHCITPLPISSKGSFICMIPDRLVHTTAFDTLDMEHWLEHITAQWDQSNRCYQKVDTYLQIIAKSIVECWLRFENPHPGVLSRVILFTETSSPAHLSHVPTWFKIALNNQFVLLLVSSTNY